MNNTTLPKTGKPSTIDVQAVMCELQDTECIISMLAEALRALVIEVDILTQNHESNDVIMQLFGTVYTLEMLGQQIGTKWHVLDERGVL